MVLLNVLLHFYFSLDSSDYNDSTSEDESDCKDGSKTKTVHRHPANCTLAVEVHLSNK